MNFLCAIIFCVPIAEMLLVIRCYFEPCIKVMPSPESYSSSCISAHIGISVNALWFEGLGLLYCTGPGFFVREGKTLAT